MYRNKTEMNIHSNPSKEMISMKGHENVV